MTASDTLADLRLYEETVDGMFARALRRWPDRDFVIAEGRRISFREMDAEIDRVARSLVALEVGRGDRVAVWMSNIWEWIAVQFATTRIGAVLTPLNTRLRLDDLKHTLSDSGATVLVTQDAGDAFAYLELIERILAQPDRPPALRHVVVARATQQRPDPFLSWAAFLALGDRVELPPQPAAGPADPAYILYTSGTTSLPKGVMLSHGSLNNAINMASGYREGDRIFLVYPLFAITGCHNAVLVAALLGGCVVLQERFDPEAAIDLIEAHACTVLACITYALDELIAAPGFAPARLASLRSAAIFPRRPEHAAVLDRFGVTEAPTGYGMTETCGPVTFTVATDAPELTAEGRPWPGDEVRLLAEDGTSPPPGAPGAILVRTPHMMRGYFANAEATAKAIDADGWLHTGDVGCWDAEGRLVWLGRVSDIIKCSGFNFAAQEVEALLLQHPAIAEVSVAGVPDASRGEVGAAFVVPHKDATLALTDIEAFCRGRMASYKIPGHLFLRQALPRTASGKVRKVELKAWFTAQQGDARR